MQSFQIHVHLSPPVFKSSALGFIREPGPGSLITGVHGLPLRAQEGSLFMPLTVSSYLMTQHLVDEPSRTTNVQQAHVHPSVSPGQPPTVELDNEYMVLLLSIKPESSL